MIGGEKSRQFGHMAIIYMREEKNAREAKKNIDKRESLGYHSNQHQP